MNNEARVGIFVFLIIVVFIVLSITIGEFSFSKKATYPITMAFTSVEGLKTGSPLELAGVAVGSVTDIALNKDFSAVVTTAINEDIHLPIDSVAAVGTKGVLGDKIIILKPGISNAIIKPGGNLPRTEVPPSVDYLLMQLGQISDNLAHFTDSLNAIFGTEEGIANIKGSIESINNLSLNLSEIVAENRDSISLMVVNLQQATDNLAVISQELAQTSHGVADIVETIYTGQGTIGKLLNDEELYVTLTQVMGTMQRLVGQMEEENTLTMLLGDSTVYYNLVTLTENLKFVSDEIAAGRGTLGHILVDDEMYYTLTETLRNANNAVAGIEEQTPISVLGTILGIVW
ncbi:MAG: MCE family protein [Deltaproteobacteria bacterium]|nr:MCE family protein [Deltaproteobacteria bacterium]